VDLVTAVPADDYFVFLISDANLAAYGVSSAMVADALLSDPRVRSYVIFIANEVEVGCYPCMLVVSADALIPDIFRLPAKALPARGDCFSQRGVTSFPWRTLEYRDPNQFEAN
jgi:hypothetical protein